MLFYRFNGRQELENSNATKKQQQEYFEDEHDKQFTRFKENIEYTVLMPGDFYRGGAAVGALVESSCGTFLAVSGVLGALLFLSALAMCWLAAKLHQAILGNHKGVSIDQLVRDASSRRYASSHCTSTDVSSVASGYTGRATTQWKDTFIIFVLIKMSASKELYQRDIKINQKTNV